MFRTPFRSFFRGVNFGTTIKKMAHFWARREARFAICPFFLRKIFFRPGFFCGHPEQLKRPPKAPGLASVAAEVLWKQVCSLITPGQSKSKAQRRFFRFCDFSSEEVRFGLTRTACHGDYEAVNRPRRAADNRRYSWNAKRSPQAGIGAIFPVQIR